MWNLLRVSLVVAFFAVSLSASADENAGREVAFQKAVAALRNGNYQEADRDLAAFAKTYAGTERALEAQVLRARALLLAGESRKALGVTSDFLRDHGEAAWSGRMRALAAQAYAALGQADASARLLRELVEKRTAPEARAAIALRHIELADQDFDGVPGKDDLGRPKVVRNPQRALQAYERARSVGVPDERRVHVDERRAKLYEEIGQHGKAAEVWYALLDAAGLGGWNSWDGVRGEDDVLEAWAVGYGRSRLSAGDRGGAREVLRSALKRFPGGKQHMEILLLLGTERIQAGLRTRDEGIFQEGVDLIRRAIEEHRDDPEAVLAQERLAQAYEARGESEKAAVEWRALVTRFPKAERVPAARDAAARNLARAGRFDEAIAEWNRFLSAHPQHGLWQQVKQRIVEASFQKGGALAEEKKVEDAVAAWRDFATQYPTDARAPMVLLAAGRLVHGEGDHEAALDLWRGVLGRYGRSPQAAATRLAIATTLEDDLGRLEDAIRAYEEILKRHARTRSAQEAGRRLQNLKGKHLQIRAERVLGSDEAPVLTVETRNIESLRVRVYRLGLEEYFKRKGTLEGVQDLQLEIVKPDATSTWTVDDYAPYQLMEGAREVPMKGAGAYVVVAGDDDLTATTLFLVSDIECVVKRSEGRELFVWAFDRKTQAPVEGARILVAGQGEVGRTGKDGVYRSRKKFSKRADRVLVLSERGAAATGIKRGPSVDRAGFQHKAFVHADRPVYRPGQTMKWRALYLEAESGHYVGGKRHAATIRIHDARGNLVHIERGTATDFGTWSGEFTIDAAAPLGNWRIDVEVPRRGTWQGTFEVQEYKKPEFTLTVLPKQGVYRTGERVEANLRLRYAFGGPVREAPVRYEVHRFDRTFALSAAEDYSWYFQDDRNRDARRDSRQGTLVTRGRGKTNDKGELEVAFDTKEQDADAEYVITAGAQDITRRWIYDQGRVPVTRADHMAVVKADRKVYRPKQELKAEVRTADARERAVPRSGTLILSRLRRVTGAPVPSKGGRFRPVRVEEVEEARYPLTTDKEGRAEIKLQVPGSGDWRLRWKAEGGRGTSVTAYVDVQATGEAEDLSRDARLTAFETLYNEGSDVELHLHSPVTGGKALLTYEGAQVLDYRIIDITNTSSLLSLPVTGKHAPNVFFKVAIPAEGRLLEADTEVVVLRHLDVRIRPTRELVKPGEELEFEVETRDANGKPISAEVGVAITDAAVFAIARDLTKNVRPYFYDRRRANGVQTASSLGWKAFGTTRQTSKDLLADAAARTGNAKAVFAASAVRLARAALDRGDLRTAVAEASKAAAADPGNYDARALLASLRRNVEASKYMADRDAGVAALDELASMERARLASEKSIAKSAAVLFELGGKRADRKAGRGGRPAGPARSGSTGGQYRGPGGAVPPGARAPRDPAAPKPTSPALEPATDNDMPYEESFGESEGLSDAPFEGPANNGTIGLGGGGGGAFARRQALRQELLEAQQYVGPSTNASIGLAKLEQQFGFGGQLALETRQRFADRAGWFPHVVTDENGRATVKVTLPDNLTTWQATARGVSKGALVGEARARAIARKDIVVRVDTPRFLTQGDEIIVPTVVHNHTDQDGSVDVTLAVEGVTSSGQDVSLKLGAGKRALVDRRLVARTPGPVRVRVRALGNIGADAMEVGFGTRVRGLRNVEGRSGLVETRGSSEVEAAFELPAGVDGANNELVVILYPGIEDALLDRLLYLQLFPYGCVEQTVHRFLPALQALSALRAANSPAAGRLERLEKAVAQMSRRLVNLQQKDGSFGWFRGRGGNLVMSAYALRGLVAARASGVPGLNNAISRAQGAVQRLIARGNEDAQALAHLALAESGRLDTSRYLSTFRRRNEALSIAGLAHLLVAAQRAGRSFDVEQLAQLILSRRVEAEGRTYWAGRRGDGFFGDDVEATGLALWALIEADMASEHVETAMAWLMERAASGGTTKSAAGFVTAAAAYVISQRSAGFGGEVDVLVDGKVVKTVKTGAGPLALDERRFVVPEAKAWKAGAHKLAFRLRGQGRLGWAAALTTWTQADELPADTNGVTVGRRYLDPVEAPAPGQAPPVKPGYTILREGARPRVDPQDLNQVVVGQRVLVRLELFTEQDREYLHVEDPLPAGFEVLADTTRGPFVWQERRDDRQVFFLERLPKGRHVLEYVMQATHLGSFTALGTHAQGMYQPEVHGRAAGRRIEIQKPGGSDATDAATPPTPDELWNEAGRLMAEKSFAQARPILDALLADQPLRDAIVEQLHARLLRIAIETDDPSGIVKAREALLRRNASRIPGGLDDQRAIAFAYDTIKEHETANRLYDGLIARGFGFERDWLEVRRTRGEELAGLDEMQETLKAFPVNNGTAEVALRTAQRYRELPRPEGRGERRAGEPMDAETLDALFGITVHFAGSAVEAPASYALIDAQRRAGDLGGAESEAERFRRRFPKSPFLDDTWFFLADVRYQRFENEPTDAAAESVRAAANTLIKQQFRDRRGRMVWSPFRARAWHILGRVHHVRGELEEAIEAYKAGRSVPDAAEALAWLTQQSVAVEPTRTLALDATPSIEVRYRNVSEITLKAYPVDLQVLFAVRKTLENLHKVDLSGIVPAHQWKAPLPNADDHRPHRTTLELPVEANGAGVWLVILQSPVGETSTLVLKTDLAVELQQIDRKVRCYVTDAEGRPVRGAYVTVSDRKRIVARGLTDGRGIFEAAGVGRRPMVVVSKGDRYALAR